MLTKYIPQNCFECFATDATKYISRPNLDHTKINEDGIFKYICYQGHTSYTVLQNPKFEILIEMALENLLDDNYRESIFNFAAALQRFFEFISEIIIAENKISEENYKLAWKNLKNSSERQLGGFILLFLFRFKEPFLVSNTMVTLRNQVIHKGKIPNELEAKEYGDYVLTTIYEIQKKVRNTISQDTIMEVVGRKISERQQKIFDKDSNARISTMCGGSPASQTFLNEIQYEDLNSLLSAMDKHRIRIKNHYTNNLYK